MRRGVWFIVVGAVVLGLLVAAVAVFGVIVPRLRPGPDPGPTFAPGELTPEESTITAVPQPDGTVRVDQVLIFDAGPGMERPAGWYLDGTQLGWKDPARTAQYGVIPRVVALEARQVPVDGPPVPLEINVDDDDLDDPFFDGRRYRLRPPRAWAPGRHRIEFSYVLGDVWVEADGVRLLVLPLRFASGPANTQPADLTRVLVRVGGVLECPATNRTLAEREPCGESGRLTYRDQLDDVEAVVVADPTGITAAPIPVSERS